MDSEGLVSTPTPTPTIFLSSLPRDSLSSEWEGSDGDLQFKLSPHNVSQLILTRECSDSDFFQASFWLPLLISFVTQAPCDPVQNKSNLCKTEGQILRHKGPRMFSFPGYLLLVFVLKKLFNFIFFTLCVYVCLCEVIVHVQVPMETIDLATTGVMGNCLWAA